MKKKKIGQGVHGSVYKINKHLVEKDYVQNRKIGLSDSFIREIAVYKSLSNTILEGINPGEQSIRLRKLSTNLSIYSRYKKTSYRLVKILPKMIPDILKCIVELNNRGVCHLDVKPANILVDSSIKPEEYILCDYGLSQFPISELDDRTIDFEKREYAFHPPDLNNYKEFSYNTDMWGLGITILNVITHKYPCNTEALDFKKFVKKYTTDKDIKEAIKYFPILDSLLSMQSDALHVLKVFYEKSYISQAPFNKYVYNKLHVQKEVIDFIYVILDSGRKRYDRHDDLVKTFLVLACCSMISRLSSELVRDRPAEVILVCLVMISKLYGRSLFTYKGFGDKISNPKNLEMKIYVYLGGDLHDINTAPMARKIYIQSEGSEERIKNAILKYYS